MVVFDHAANPGRRAGAHRIASAICQVAAHHRHRRRAGSSGPGELLVRIEAAGVCHSDLSVVDGNRVRPTPMLLGHEAAGIVERVGDGVIDVVIGQRVVMTFLPRCGQCAACVTDGLTPCQPGSAANNAGTLLDGGMRLSREDGKVYHHLGVSGFATHAVVHRASVVPVDRDVPPPVACWGARCSPAAARCSMWAGRNRDRR